jgi:hypothetical protein
MTTRSRAPRSFGSAPLQAPKHAALVLFCLALAAASAAAAQEPTLEAVFYGTQERLDRLAREMDLWAVDRSAGMAIVRLSAEEKAGLAAEGVPILPAAAFDAAPEAPAAMLDPRFHYFDDFVSNAESRYVIDDLMALAASYPELTELVDVGDAWEASHGGHGRDMLVLRITNEDPILGAIEEKPPFVLMATIHAREVMTAELALRWVHYLLDGWDGAGGHGEDPLATWLVDRHVAYVLVMQNPDGHADNEQDTGAFRRKNTNADACPGAQSGIDLNRNHSFLWGCCDGSSTDACDPTYRGPSAASEPETQAFQSFFAAVMDDANGPNGDDQLPPAAPADAPGIFLTLHSYSDLVLWPWGFTDFGPAPNDAQLETIGRKLALFNGYDPAGFLYEVDGVSDDWAYGKLGVASFTFEVGPFGGGCAGFFPPWECLDGLAGRAFWEENLPAFLYALTIAPAPYTLAYGPDAFDAATAPIGPTAALLTATVADRRLTGDPTAPIVGAEYFLGAVGPTGTGRPLSPVDGSWGDPSEVVEATVELDALPPGRHLVLVRGLADGGPWGPLTAAWVDTDGPLFTDDFESGDTGAWTTVVQ